MGFLIFFLKNEVELFSNLVLLLARSGQGNIKTFAVCMCSSSKVHNLHFFAKKPPSSTEPVFLERSPLCLLESIFYYSSVRIHLFWQVAKFLSSFYQCFEQKRPFLALVLG